MSEETPKKNTPDPEELTLPSATFLAEQDGEPERELKAKLVELFRADMNVHSAFLVRVRYRGSQGINVALALATSRQDIELVKSIGVVFHNMFGAHESLDVIFLRHKQQAQILQIAKPFYTSPSFNSQS